MNKQTHARYNRFFAVFVGSGILAAFIGQGSQAAWATDSSFPAPVSTETALVGPDETGPIEQTVQFEYPISLLDAIDLIPSVEGKVIAIRYENPGVVGEYNVSSPRDPELYLASFEEQYGGEPLAVGFAVEAPVAATSSSLRVSAEDPEGETPVEPEVVILDVSAPELRATDDSGGTATEYVDAAGERSSAANAAVASSPTQTFPTPGDVQYWKPETVEVDIEKDYAQNRVSFRQYAYWDNLRTSPTWTHDRYGMEFGVDLYDLNRPGGGEGRPFLCGDNYWMPFVAQNRNWDWGISIGRDGVNLASVGAYPDDNDDLDACNKNSMTIGIKEPQNLPKVPGKNFYSVLFTISAPAGTTSSSLIGATVTLLDDYACYEPFTQAHLKKCMGLTETIPFPEYEGNPRLVLNEDREWFAAPDRCWVSTGFGFSKTMEVIHDSPNGCYYYPM